MVVTCPVFPQAQVKTHITAHSSHSDTVPCTGPSGTPADLAEASFTNTVRVRTESPPQHLILWDPPNW